MRLLITAGPTREPIDAVRFISNRSSGAMGLAIAEAGVAAGHDTTLLLGPVCLAVSQREQLAGCRVYRFDSSAELKQLLEAHWADQNTLIMAAAVADHRPACVTEGKPPHRDGSFSLNLSSTPDLVSLMAASKRDGQRVVAFALEEAEHLEARAADKMRRKGVDAIVANPLETMHSESIRPVWMTATGQREALDRMDKPAFARWLIDRIGGL